MEEKTKINNENNSEYVNEDFVERCDLRIDALHDYIKTHGDITHKNIVVITSNGTGNSMLFMRGHQDDLLVTLFGALCRHFKTYDDIDKKERAKNSMIKGLYDV